MRAYVLTEDQLVENGYPRPTAEEGVATIHWREGEAPPEIQPVGPNGQLNHLQQLACIVHNISFPEAFPSKGLDHLQQVSNYGLA